MSNGALAVRDIVQWIQGVTIIGLKGGGGLGSRMI